MHEDDRKTLAEALSGFANSDGGVIVWGVDCRQGVGKDESDATQSVKPIVNLDRWMNPSLRVCGQCGQWPLYPPIGRAADA